MVGFQRVVIEEYWNALGSFANLSGFHCRPYRHTHAGLCDPVVLQHQLLSLRSSAPVTSQGRNEEWSNAKIPRYIDHRTSNHWNVRHATATASNRHGLGRFQPAVQTKLVNLLRHLRRNVTNLSGVKVLL